MGVLAAAAGATVLDDLAIVADLDACPDQMAHHRAAVLDRQGSTRPPTAVAERLAAWQSLLSSLPVCAVQVPFASRIVFPATCPRHRRELDAFCGLIRASAVLYHRQRRWVEGVLIADEADAHLAAGAARGVLGRRDGDLPARAVAVFDLLTSAGRTTITTPEILALLPGWPRTTVRHALEALVEAGLLRSEAGGRGRQARSWQVEGVRPEPEVVIGLMPGGPPGVSPGSMGTTPFSPPEMATNGQTDLANICRAG